MRGKRKKVGEEIQWGKRRLGAGEGSNILFHILGKENAAVDVLGCHVMQNNPKKTVEN